MKQRITVEQLNELTEKQKGKLREWWEPTVADMCVNEKEGGYNVVIEVMYKKSKDDFLPLLSIGQMIDIIDSSNYFLKYQFIVGKSKNARLPEEFCDALWEAVKSVL